jgi:cytochrome c peroxidase
MRRLSKSWMVLGMVLLAVLAVPLVNLGASRAPIAVEAGPASWAKVSPILQNKCVDCHAPELAHMPWYAKLPPASWLIQADQRRGSAFWRLTRAELTARTALDEARLAALEWASAEREMPPPQYLALHWTSLLTTSDQALIRNHITALRSATPEGRQMAAAHRGKPIQILLAPTDLVPAKVELGNRLFEDRRLSGDGTVSRASCHGLDKGGTDQSAVSTGIRNQTGGINDPSVFNSSYNVRQFWDGRAQDLYEQAGGPVENPIEMGARFSDVIARLGEVEDYRQRFAQVYGAEGISKRTITDAIAEFEKSLVTVDSPFDKYLRGDDGAITPEQKQGYALFKSVGCSTCHFGPAVGGRTFG